MRLHKTLPWQHLARLQAMDSRCATVRLRKPPAFTMKYTPLRIRNFLPEDGDSVVELETDGEHCNHGSFRTLAFDLAESLGMPNRLPERNLFVAETSGAIVGYAYVMPELEIDRVVLSCFLHPNHRHGDLASNLVEHALRRAKELGVGKAQVNVHEKNTATQEFFSEKGFDCVRHFLEMLLDLTAQRLPDVNKSCSFCRYLQPGEEDKLTAIQNRSFLNAWGFNPSAKPEIVYRTRLQNCFPTVIFLCKEEHPIGYCWTRLNSGGGRHKPVGQIHMLGVEPRYRGKGIGKQLLLAGLAHLQREGIQFVELTVDEENEAACNLYRSVGFGISGRTVWYEKTLD
jgi:mycothiol synthase